jgi:hypothetical protein
VRSLPSPLHPIKDAPDLGISRTSPPLQSTRAAPPPPEAPPAAGAATRSPPPP